MKSLLKIIIHVLKLPQKNFESFTSKPNAHGTFWNLHIKINLKIYIAETNRQWNWNLACFLFSKFNMYNIKIIKFWQLISYGNIKTQPLCPLNHVIQINFIKILIFAVLDSHPSGTHVRMCKQFLHNEVVVNFSRQLPPLLYTLQLLVLFDLKKQTKTITN